MTDGGRHKPVEKELSTTKGHSAAEKREQFTRAFSRGQNPYEVLSNALNELIAGGVVEEDGLRKTLELTFKNINGILRLNLYWSDAETHALTPYQFYKFNKRFEIVSRNFNSASTVIGKTLDGNALAYVMLINGLAHSHSNSLAEKLVKKKFTQPLGICWNKKKKSIYVFDLDPANKHIHKTNLAEFAVLENMLRMPSGIIVPLLYKKGLLGMMEIYGSHLYFDGDETNADSLIKYSVGVARILALHKKIQTDQLTRLLPKEMFEKDLKKKIADSIESRKPLSLLYLDCDDFKLINDTYGHTIGDMVLINIAKRILESTYNHDKNYRNGGEEFAILSNVNEYVAIKIARRIAENIKQPMRVKRPTSNSENEHIDLSRTVCIGIAPLSAVDMNTHDSIEKIAAEMKRIADEALYKAKAVPGKDSICIAEKSGGRIEYKKV